MQPGIGFSLDTVGLGAGETGAGDPFSHLGTWTIATYPAPAATARSTNASNACITVRRRAAFLAHGPSRIRPILSRRTAGEQEGRYAPRYRAASPASIPIVGRS